MANRAREAAPTASLASRAVMSVPLDSGAWFRVGVGEGLEVSMRADHPAARNPELRGRIAAAVARVLADSAEESAR
jgi:hypothetical protein